jgi:hypothetical protein
VPVFMNGGNPEPLYDRQLVERRVALRDVREVAGPNDPAAFVVR